MMQMPSSTSHCYDLSTVFVANGLAPHTYSPGVVSNLPGAPTGTPCLSVNTSQTLQFIPTSVGAAGGNGHLCPPTSGTAIVDPNMLSTNGSNSSNRYPSSNTATNNYNSNYSHYHHYNNSNSFKSHGGNSASGSNGSHHHHHRYNANNASNHINSSKPYRSYNSNKYNQTSTGHNMNNANNMYHYNHHYQTNNYYQPASAAAQVQQQQPPPTSTTASTLYQVNVGGTQTSANITTETSRSSIYQKNHQMPSVNISSHYNNHMVTNYNTGVGSGGGGSGSSSNSQHSKSIYSHYNNKSNSDTNNVSTGWNNATITNNNHSVQQQSSTGYSAPVTINKSSTGTTVVNTTSTMNRGKGGGGGGGGGAHYNNKSHATYRSQTVNSKTNGNYPANEQTNDSRGGKSNKSYSQRNILNSSNSSGVKSSSHGVTSSVNSSATFHSSRSSRAQPQTSSVVEQTFNLLANSFPPLPGTNVDQNISSDVTSKADKPTDSARSQTHTVSKVTQQNIVAEVKNAQLSSLADVVKGNTIILSHAPLADSTKHGMEFFCDSTTTTHLEENNNINAVGNVTTVTNDTSQQLAKQKSANCENVNGIVDRFSLQANH